MPRSTLTCRAHDRFSRLSIPSLRLDLTEMSTLSSLLKNLILRNSYSISPCWMHENNCKLKSSEARKLLCALLVHQLIRNTQRIVSVNYLFGRIWETFLIPSDFLRELPPRTFVLREIECLFGIDRNVVLGTK